MPSDDIKNKMENSEIITKAQQLLEEMNKSENYEYGVTDSLSLEEIWSRIKEFLEEITR